jgi:hypothetical protein
MSLLKWAMAWLLVLGLGLTSQVRAEEEDEEEEEEMTLEASAEAPEDESGLGGWIDLRPSWTGSAGTVHAENEAALEYRLGGATSFGYTQEFRSNLLRAGIESTSTGLELVMGDGYLWGNFAEFARVPGTGITFSYEPRLYLPTARAEQKAGLIFATRQYLKANWRLTSNLDLFLWEIPIGYVYYVEGYEEEDGPVANRSFENRIEAGPRLTLFDEKVVFKMPLVVQSLRHRHYSPDAANDGGWAHYVWVNPEILVTVAENTVVGLGYYSDTLMDESLSRGDVEGGLKRGVVQAIFQQSL